MATKRKRFIWLATGLASVTVCWFWTFEPREHHALSHAAAVPARTAGTERGVGAEAAATGHEMHATGEATGEASGIESGKPEAMGEVDEARVRELLRRDFDGLAETRRPSGGYGVALNGRFRHLSVALPGPENAGVARCFCGADELLHALTTPHQPPAR